MSYWIALLSHDELKECDNKTYSNLESFDFGEIEYHFFKEIISELNSLKPKLDNVVALLEYLFLQSSESQQADMFLRFVAANLAQNKTVLFYDDQGLV